MHLLQLQGITKRFGRLSALGGIDITIRRGTTFGLLGPNGAGKTTLIRIITGILGPDQGSIVFGNRPLRSDDSNRMGYMPEERGLYKRMKVGEQLLYLARLKDLSSRDARRAIEEWLDRFQIADWYNRRIEDLSKGMQQKVQFIATVLHNPELIILDEPFSGLDPVNTSLIREEMRRLQQQGATIIFSTHRMEQVGEICEDIALINHGQVILEGEVERIREQFKRNHFAVEFSADPGNLELSGYDVLERQEGRILVHIDDMHSSNELLHHLLAQNVTVTSFQEILPTVNDIFISLVEGNRLPFASEKPEQHA